MKIYKIKKKLKNLKKATEIFNKRLYQCSYDDDYDDGNDDDGPGNCENALKKKKNLVFD